MRIRLQKYLAKIGIGSRRKCEKFIQQGKVKVNQNIVTELGIKIDPKNDVIEVNGTKIEYKKEEYIYIILNKPRGYLTTLSDPYQRPIIKDLLTNIKKRIYPCGRLDFNSEGLVFLTNDGELAYNLMHPSRKIEKTYIVKVKGNPDQGKLDRLAKGITLVEEKKIINLLPCQISRLKADKKNTYLKIKIREGKKRQIRRMMKYIGLEVLELKRIQIGLLKLGRLKSGEFRYLNKKEINILKEFIISKIK